jgi:hypothetical protein
MTKGRPTYRMSINEKLDYYTYPEPNTGCWLWGASVTTDGYGRVNMGRTQIGAHRASYERHKGAIPEGMFVCHTCDVPSCVNPEHLFLGTSTDNLRDASRKGRMRRGEGQPNSKLTTEQALAIFNDPRSGSAIAQDYPVCKSVINYIKRGKIWRHIHEA